MTTQTGQQQQAPVNGSAPPPAVDHDAAAYEALRKELNIEAEAPAEVETPSEPAGESVPQQQDAKGRPEHVPYAEHENVQKALREARAAQKAAEDRFAQFMRIVEEGRGRAKAEPERKESDQPKVPDVQADPIGHFQAKIAQLEQQLVQAHQGGQRDTQQIQAQLQEQQMWASVQASEVDIKDPKSANHKADYDAACSYLEAGRIRQLDRMYPSDSPQIQAWCRQQGYQDANQYKLELLNHDRRNVAIHALQSGISPAQLYYNLALDSGYQPKANGKAQDQSLVEKAKQQVEATKRGSRASVTLSGGAGNRKGAENISIQELSQKFIDDPDEASRIFEDMGRRGLLGA